VAAGVVGIAVCGHQLDRPVRIRQRVRGTTELQKNPGAVVVGLGMAGIGRDGGRVVGERGLPIGVPALQEARNATMIEEIGGAAVKSAMAAS
jgi:hypothetical protein